MDRKRVRLPVAIGEAGCVTDCWVFNRLAILRTSEYYEDWVASHYPLYGDCDHNFFFGETSTVLPAYHDPVLERRQIPLFALTEDTVVEKMRESLSGGSYLVMTARVPAAEEFFHEVLLYGFDDGKGCFLAAELGGRFFHPAVYTYSYIRDILPEVKKHYRETEYRGLGNSIYYQFPLTALRISPDYCTDGCPFEAYHKLDDEWSGTCHRKGSLQEMAGGQQPGMVYRGISCLYALKNMLDWELEGKQFSPSFRGLSSAAKKMSEHQNFVLMSMKYLKRKWGTVMEGTEDECIREYGFCLQAVERWANMVLKYEYTKNRDLLRRIIVEIPEIYERERQCLDTFLHKTVKWKEFNELFI